MPVRKRFRAVRFAGRLALCSFLFFVHCSEDQSTGPLPRDDYPVPEDRVVVGTEGQRGGQLRCSLAGEPRTFNYLAASDARSKLLAYLTTGTLLEFDALNQEVREGLCKEYEISEDGLLIRLFLREGLFFSDGRPFTADDIIFTFDAIHDEASSNVLKDVLLIDGEPLEISKLGDYSVEIRFPRPFAAAEYILTTIPVLPEHRLPVSTQKVEELWTLDTPVEEMAGLGPFVIHSHEPGRRTILRYNPHYWKVDSRGSRLPYLDQLVFEYISDRNTQLLRFQAEELDLLDQLLRPEDLKVLVGDDHLEFEDIGPSSNLALFWFNLNHGLNPATGRPFIEKRKKKWFSDSRFRQAVSYAISRRSIVRNVYLGLATKAFSLIPASNKKWHAANLETVDDDKEMARRVLRDAGFSWNRTGAREYLLDRDGRRVEFGLITRSDDVLGKIAAILQQDLEALGMTVVVQQEELRSVISRIMRGRDYDSALMNLDFPIEPMDTGNVLLSSGAMHIWSPRQIQPATAWEERIDQLFWQQGRMLDEQQRFRLFREIQQILAQQKPLIPLVNRNVLVAWRKGLRNLKPASIFPFAMWNIGELYWEPAP